jgi:hypothetical protein
MKRLFLGIVCGLALGGWSAQVNAQHHAQTAEQAQQHETDHAAVNQRGDKVMGFSHEKTTHHFLLNNNGGVIEVTANDPQDVASRDLIRQHLRHIAKKFAAGDFTAPMLIHAQTPPGVPVLQKLKAAVKYQFEEIEKGGRVRLSTNDTQALVAIHEFLRFQIKDHKTGDSGQVEP